MSSRSAALALGSVVLLLSLATSMPTIAAEKVLNVGYNDSLSGPGAVFGVPQQRAIQIAVDEVNGAGGIKVGADNYKINLITNDDKANPTEATNSVRKLIDRDNVKFLIGFCCSGPTSAVASFIGNEDVLMLVGTAAEKSITTRGNSNLFRNRPPGDFTGAAAGRFIASKGIKKLAVIGALDAALYNQYLAALKVEFEKLGGQIIATESAGLGDRDMTAQLTKIKGLNPDGLFVEIYVEQAAFIYRQANELGLKVPTFGFHGGSEEQFLRVLSSEQMEGVYDLRPTELTPAALGPGATKFAESYKKRFGENPAPNTGYAYDGIYILKAAIEKAGSVDVKKVTAAMASMNVPNDVVLKYLPVDGKLFDQNGQAYITNGAFQWRNGKWTFVSELPSDTKAYSEALSAARASKNPRK